MSKKAEQIFKEYLQDAMVTKLGITEDARAVNDAQSYAQDIYHMSSRMVGKLEDLQDKVVDGTNAESPEIADRMIKIDNMVEDLKVNLDEFINTVKQVTKELDRL